MSRERSYDEEEAILQRIKDSYDPDGLVDTLCLTSEELVEAFRELILQKLYLFDVEDDNDGFVSY